MLTNFTAFRKLLQMFDLLLLRSSPEPSKICIVWTEYQQQSNGQT